MRIIQYCQHVLGIGHFIRSLEIAAKLSEHEVIFIEGGRPVENIPVPVNVTRLFLPPLEMDPNFKEMHGFSQQSVEEIKLQRKKQLLQWFNELRPDCLLIELYPFGRKRFGFELIPLLELARTTGCKAFCSLRDILVEKDNTEKYENRVLRVVNDLFDGILVHSDPNIITLDETFQRMHKIKPPILYTGFVAREAPTPEPAQPPQIAVSSGGGRVGVDLLKSAVQAIKMIDSPITTKIFQGPFLLEKDREELHRLKRGDKRIHFEEFSGNYPDVLKRASVSVSMAGYNTCMDILRAGIAALVYPFDQNREQHMRATKLEQQNALSIIRSLDPQTLKKQILEKLNTPRTTKNFSINLEGAADTAKALKQLTT